MDDGKPSVVFTVDASALPETVLDLIPLLMKLKQDGNAGISVGLVRRYIEKLVVFDEKFTMGASNPDQPLSLSDIENLITTLADEHVGLANELAWEKIRSFDESPLIEKKKGSTLITT
jgi:hypothetical protein